MRSATRPVAVLLLAPFITALSQPSAQAAETRIVIEEFSVEPQSLALGEVFTVRIRAAATGIAIGSFVVRTADDVKKEATSPGFPLYSSGRYYVAEDGRYNLTDNGPLDRDPAKNVFALELSTKGWKEGEYALAAFASNRPAPGPFVAARHDLAVTVRGQQVTIEDLGGDDSQASLAIRQFQARPACLRAGEPLELSFTLDRRRVKSLQLSDVFYISPAETLSGFTYDDQKKKGIYPIELPASTPAGRGSDIAVTAKLATGDWPPGVRHLMFQVLGPAAHVIDERAFAVKVYDPRDRLEVTVEPSTFLAPGTHFNRFLNLSDGTLLTEGKLSRDGGQTWSGTPIRFGNGAEQLRDGSVLGLDYRCVPIEGKTGWYGVARYFSPDGQRFDEDRAEMFVPEAKAAMGHALHVGPLFMRSILQRLDGSLVALMGGWFKSDTALCPYGRGRPYSRTYVCDSADGGKTWRYLSTIGYKQIGSEGFNEASMKRLPDGSWLAALRSGNERDLLCQDNPIMYSVSRDEGRTWSPPERTGLEGCFPSLAVLSDGQLAMSYGRPGAMLAFSADHGRTWTDATCVDATPYSGYTDVVEIEPGLLLVGFGAAGYLDPQTGQRSEDLRLARVRYRNR